MNYFSVFLSSIRQFCQERQYPRRWFERSKSMGAVKWILTIILLMLNSVPTFAQTIYYVSQSGNDADPGTEAQPWKTLNKISRTTFSPGDAILFKCGETFYGEISKQGAGFIGTEANPIVFATYGTGAKPILIGDCSEGTWVRRAGYDSIWCKFIGYAASVQGYCDSGGVNVLMDAKNGEIKFYLSHQDSLDKYLKSFTKTSYGPASWEGWDTMYVKTWDGNSPSSATNNVILFRNNIWSGKWLVIRDLEFRSYQTSINPYPMMNSIIRNCEFRDNRYISVFLAGGSSHNLVDSCTVHNGGYTGMYSWYSHGNRFTHDTVRNISPTVRGTVGGKEHAGFGAERDTGTVFEYCRMDSCSAGAFDSFYNFNDTMRYCTVINCPTGIMLNGVGWVAHNNIFTTEGNFMDAAIKVDISYAFDGRTYLLTGGQTHVYNNTFTVRGSGLWASSCAAGSNILFENNTVYGTASNTNFSRLETINTTSINNTFYGSGRWLTGTWPNQIPYATLEALRAATGYESGSMWYSSPTAPTGTFTADRDTLPVGGGTVTLRWTSVGATSASISPLIGIVAVNDSITTDTIYVSTEFVLTRIGPTGNSTQSVNIYVESQSGGDNPLNYILKPNYPNPFNGNTIIEFFLPTDGYASLKVFDILGREIQTLAQGMYVHGIHQFRWNAGAVASGVYYCTFTSGAYMQTQRMMVVR